MAASYCSAADLTTYGVPDTVDAPTQADKIEIASRIVDDYCGLTSLGLSGAFAGTHVMTITISDVRKPIVPLPPVPCSSITNVTVNNMPLSPAVTSTVQAAPAPTTTTFPVAPGDGSRFQPYRATSIGGQMAEILTASGDLITLAAPLPAPPAPGQSVAQYAYIVEPWGLRLYWPGLLDPDQFPGRTYSQIGTSPWWMTNQPYGSEVMVTGTFGYTSVPSPVKQATVLVAAFLCQLQGEVIVDSRIQGLQVEGYGVRYINKGTDEITDTTGVLEADRLLRVYRAENVLVG